MKEAHNHTGNCINTVFKVSTLLLLLPFFMAGSGTVCFAGQAKPSAAVTAVQLNTYLGELDTVINNAEEIYDHAKLNKWKHVANKLNVIKKTEQSRLIAANDASTNLLPRLIEATADLEQAVTTQHRLDTMIFANRIMIIGAKMAAPFNPRIPTNVAVIGYSARKLEILSEAQHVEKMSDVVYKIHLSWQPLIPQVIEHGGSREIKKFAEIMKRLEAAKTPDEYARHATSVLEEVTVLEQIFLK
ncbi:MAG TPA: hypothetical protein VIH45_00485 [Desulfuromonadaceae bacterium]